MCADTFRLLNAADGLKARLKRLDFSCNPALATEGASPQPHCAALNQQVSSCWPLPLQGCSPSSAPFVFMCSVVQQQGHLLSFSVHAELHVINSAELQDFNAQVGAGTGAHMAVFLATCPNLQLLSLHHTGERPAGIFRLTAAHSFFRCTRSSTMQRSQ